MISMDAIHSKLHKAFRGVSSRMEGQMFEGGGNSYFMGLAASVMQHSSRLLAKAALVVRDLSPQELYDVITKEPGDKSREKLLHGHGRSGEALKVIVDNVWEAAFGS